MCVVPISRKQNKNIAQYRPKIQRELWKLFSSHLLYPTTSSPFFSPNCFFPTSSSQFFYLNFTSSTILYFQSTQVDSFEDFVICDVDLL
ncbi:hypothetical protein H5410_061718 [Solanum commersonii]|uniref:Uncharacterized protein n=1 Tax=Solanum commersonii TaxID=4109 RepID=A0A9J5WA17_SOLCO|nr:hypothetical protein H5410_061718 [Solanum commersonii]